MGAIAHREMMHPKEKGPAFASPDSMGIKFTANRPDPEGPGGLGAEESGAERTGPTQWVVFRNPAGRPLGGNWAVL